MLRVFPPTFQPVNNLIYCKTGLMLVNVQHRHSTFAAVLQDKLDVFCCQFNPPYRKRWRQYILPQFLSSLTRAITHKVIFWGGEIRPCNSSIAYPRFEVYKTFLCVFMSNFMVFMR